MTENTRKTRFETVFRPHFDALYAAARRMTLTPADAEDLVQDVALKAFEKLEELEKIEFQRAWLLKVMHNRFIDTHRSAGRSPVDQASTGVDSEDPDESRTSAWLPEETLNREIRVTRILMAMNRLDEESATLVSLRDIEGLSITELEQITGMPSGTIKSKLYRSRERLGRLLSSDETFKPHLKVIGKGH